LSGDREGPAPTVERLGAALREVVAQPPRGRDAEALAAFVFAWQSEFPTSFTAALGADAISTVAWAREQLRDDNRYLKLRRIAIAHLSEIL
jgi:hypothetical protein